MPPPRWRSPETPLRVGVSTCLLGEKVRFDGGHKRDPFLVEVLGPFVEFVPVCPEVELGMGTPRPAIRLKREAGEVRLVEARSGRDHSDAMRRFSVRRARELAALDLCGWVLKKDSPTCGMERVKVWRSQAPPARDGVGFFAAALMERLPHLPVEEEGRLRDARLRENFVERLFAYRRLRALFEGRWTLGALVDFHTAHKLQLMAHSPRDHRALGRLVADASRLPRPELRARYEAGFMGALRHRATPRRHTDVLQHMLGHFKKRLGRDDRRELLQVIEDYRRGLLPLVVPVTLFRHHVRARDVPYLAGQVYLEPHPRELMLRNHV